MVPWRGSGWAARRQWQGQALSEIAQPSERKASITIQGSGRMNRQRMSEVGLVPLLRLTL